jgi:hypothetical protein
MKTNMKKISALFLTAIAVFSFNACQKNGMDTFNQSSALSIFLTDGPGDFSKVLVEVKEVEVKLDTSIHKDDDEYGDKHGDKDDDRDDDRRGHDEFGQWDTLQIAKGVYDLLSLRNGVDTLLAAGNIKGKIRKIRLTVGTVTVIKDSVSYPVTMLAGLSNYLYVQIKDEHLDHSQGRTRVWVDFDISTSIVLINGTYYLNPKLKPFCDKNFGRVEGIVLPADAKAKVIISNGTTTATAIPESNGEYKIRGLAEGTYTVTFHSENGYKDQVLTNIYVKKSSETKIPTVTLQK